MPAYGEGEDAMSEVEMTGFVTAMMEARTVEDLRTLVGWLNKYSIPNSTGIDFDRGKIYVELTGDTSVSAKWIECGDHVPPVSRFDILIDTHTHDDDANAPKRPAKFDWPAWDRYGDESRPE